MTSPSMGLFKTQEYMYTDVHTFVSVRVCTFLLPKQLDNPESLV